jgi:Ca2+-transporting ATPase
VSIVEQGREVGRGDGGRSRTASGPRGRRGRAGGAVSDGHRESPATDVARLIGLAPADVYEALGTAPDGLASVGAAEREVLFGPNELPAASRPSTLAEFAAQFTNMFALVLVAAAAITFVTYLSSTPRNLANLELAIGILAVVLINAAIGFAQEHAAERTAEALQAMVPTTARVLRGGELVELAAARLVPGDVVVLDAGDAVPADCRLVEAHGALVEMAALTGESRPTPRIATPVDPRTPVAEARNCVFMGTSMLNGRARAVVFATGLATEFGRIYRLTAGMAVEDSPLQRQVTAMAKRVAAVAIGAGSALFALRAAVSHSVIGSFVFALGVMVALVPEGLPATMSVSLAVAVRRMARRHALIKRLTAVEALGSTTVICTDKTGTLTKAEMTVQELWESGRSHPIAGAGYAPEGTVDGPEAVRELLCTAALCSDARLLPPDPLRRLGWRVLGDTTEGALLVAAAKAGVDLDAERLRTPRVGGFPFDSDRKLMSTVHRTGAGRFESFVKGSPQAVLERCESVRWGGETVVLEDGLRKEVAAANDHLASRGLRVLAVARRTVSSGHDGAEEAERHLCLLGLVAMSDPPRPEVLGSVAACRRAGIRIFMITGDYGLTAEAVARRVGLLSPDGPVRIVNGSELDGTTDQALAEMMRPGVPVLFARARPEHKMRIVGVLQASGEVVAVTGDGVNDAPALKRASIGVSMGEGGTDVARAASVMILLDDSFASIAAAVELGRAVYNNIRKFLVYLFSHNLAELAPILAAVAVGFPLVPLSALQVLAIDLGSDVLPALALGTEPPEPGTMDRPPRPVTEQLFNWAVVRRFLFLGGIQSLGVVAAFFWRIHTAHLPFGSFTAANPTYREALTMTQAGIVVSQFFNSFAVRTEERSIFSVGFLSNRPLVLAGLAGLGFVTCVSYVPALNAVFHTAPLKLSDWLVLVAFGGLLLAAEEARKAWRRWRRRPDGRHGAAGSGAPTGKGM